MGDHWGKNKKKVKDLEKEIQELTRKVATLEEGLKTAESFINNLKNNNINNININNNIMPEATTSGSNDNNNDNDNNNNNSAVSTESTKQKKVNYKRSKRVQTPLLTFSEDEINNIEQVVEIEQEPSEHSKNPIKKQNAESWIGKILMGVIASVLVFIALVTFAKIILPYLTDPIKIALMFIASIALTGAGYILNRKNPENTFYKALLACGAACIYISILVTNLYFKATTPVVTYILITIWAIIITFLRKGKQDWLFFVIGNVGYVGSIVYSESLIKHDINSYEVSVNNTSNNSTSFKTIKEETISKDKNLIIPVLIYIIMIGIVYQVIYWKTKLQKCIQSIINILALLLFQIIMSVKYRDITEVTVISIVTISLALTSSIVYIVADFFKPKKMKFYISIANTLVYLLSFLVLCITLEENIPTLLFFFVVIIPAIIFEIINIYWRYKNNVKSCGEISLSETTIINTIFSTILFIIAASIVGISKHFIFYSGIVLIFYALILLYGMFTKDILFKYQGWIMIGFCMILEMKTEIKLPFVITATILTLLLFIIESVIFNDSEFFKVLNYIVLLIWIIRIGIYICDEIKAHEYFVMLIIYGIMGLINVVLIFTKFYKTKGKEEGKNVHIVLDIINLIYIIYGTFVINILNDRIDRHKSINYSYSSQSDDQVTKEKEKSILDNEMLLLILHMIIVFILACINLPLKEKGNKERYIYTAVKFACLIIFSLKTFNVPNIAISITMIAFAVVCITIGFKNRLIGKELRILGLGLTLVFVVKLLVFDIDFSTSTLRAVGFLIAGVLCFGISAIYNYFEKQGKNNESEPLE
ncbi:hypothetical protein BCR32DRAFT_329953 [Anaeromyces robustus]|jgi:hypothetical protein|uniref:DUF2339 domain-containing protein n=1 Tax=Anaeromyces robustus TaxID=1754192 RepID=A0A1Y1WP05_9FUNG|nr:hypothetical protein BCR32DRAFT_329953 [Anaeromyces robustus]|eukprot:ORX75105.1 hypothetical protein BCR32DRAFT_329953 [Anaeromyces robustus]